MLETARALLFQSKLPIRYWRECVLTATHIINRLLSSYLKNKCPYEVLYNKKPNYSQLRSFGCLCYPTVPKVLRDKFEPRTTPHVFLGYIFGTKGYKVMNLATKKLHISRDVIFHEHVFPFTLSTESSSFPSVLRSFSSPDYTISDSYKNCVSDYDNVTDTTPSHLPNQSTENPNTPSTTAITSSTSSQHDTSIVVQRRSHWKIKYHHI